MTAYPRLAGIDGCRQGWVATVIDGGDPASARRIFATRLEELIEEADVGFAVVDMPIGFTAGPERRDVEPAMRQRLRGRASSVFPTPCRAALSARDYREACEINAAHLGKRLPLQSFAIFPKMREADAAARRLGQDRLREGHPEVAFAVLTGQPLLSRKRKREGFEERRALLEQLGFPVAALVEPVSGRPFQRDDVIDATILAWVARRYTMNIHKTFPPVPSRDAVGLEMSVIA